MAAHTACQQMCKGGGVGNTQMPGQHGVRAFAGMALAALIRLALGAAHGLAAVK